MSILRNWNTYSKKPYAQITLPHLIFPTLIPEKPKLLAGVAGIIEPYLIL